MYEGFHKDSLVSTIGKDVTISNIVDHFVEFYDVDTGEDSFSPVIDIPRYKTTSVVEIITDIGTKLVCGPDTMIYVLNKSEFVYASNLELSDKLVCPTGESIQKIIDIYINTDLDDSNNEISIIYPVTGGLGYFVEGILVKSSIKGSTMI